jgi:hypothetical protein
MATLIVYPDAANLHEREINQIKEPTFFDYLNAHVPNWDRGPTGHKLKSPRFVAVINGENFAPQRWNTQLLLESDKIEVVIPPKGMDPISWALIAIAVLSAGYSYYVMNEMSQIGSSSSTVPDGSNIYEVNVQANSAELMGVRSQWFGYHKVVPSYLCSPFKYYDEDGNSRLCVMLHVTEGECLVSSSNITIAGSPINNLGDDVDWQLFAPGEDVSVHEAHKHMYTAEEVGGTDSSSGLDFIGPADAVVIDDDDDYTIVLSGNTIRFKSGSKTKNVAWDDDTTFTLTGTSSTSVLFDDIVEIVDGGNNDVTGEAIPDRIVGTGFSAVLAIGDEFQLSGAGSSNDDTYVVATVSDTELTLKDTDGNDVTWLTEAASVTVKFTTTDTDDGHYRVTDTDTSYRLVVERVGDDTWTSFAGGTYASGIKLEVTSDNLPDYQLGPFVACPAGYTTNYIEIDMLRSNGWGEYDNGDLNDITVEWEAWIRDTDLGDEDQWQIFPYTYTGASYDQIGETHVIELDNAIRPEVMLVRKTASEDDSSYLDELQWMRLKVKLPTATSYANSTTLAVSINSDSSLSSSATNKIKVLLTRKLPVPDGNGGWTSENVATRSIASAVRYLVHNSGGSDDDIDMDMLLYYHENVWEPNQEYFDGGFVDETTVYAALKNILQAGMAEFCFDVGKILPKRLFEKTTAGHVYTPDVMLDDGLTINTTLYDPDVNDGLIVYYMDPTDWTTGSVRCWLGDKDSITKWGELELTKGVTSKTRAWRIGMRALRRLKTETVSYSFKTEMDALNSSYLDYAELCDDLPNFGQFGEVRDWQRVKNDNDESVAKITVDKDLEWTDGQTHYMTIRRHDGTGNGPFVATKVDDRAVMLSGNLDFIPNLTGAIEPPLWMFGDADRYSEQAIIKSIKPSIDGYNTKCTVTASNYSADIFKDDANEVPDDTVTWWE